MPRIGVTLVVVLAGCSHYAPTAPAPPSTEATPRDAEAKARELPPLAPMTPPAPVEAAAPVRHVRDAPPLSPTEIADALLLHGDPRAACVAGGDAAEAARCLIRVRFAGDDRAAKLAIDLFDQTGDVAGELPEEMMEGGYRGKLHLVPVCPMLTDRHHLAWVAEAARDYDRFFDALGVGASGPPDYVWRGLTFRFMRSVAARTPSAYATDWTIAYNVDGSLTKSADAVRELLFHEGFHLNDQAHGDWSTHALRGIYDGVVARCGTKLACLTPFSPTEMVVRGGTYYAFQPNNGDGVHEYAAELALRYYREERAMLYGSPPAHSFKCGPDENMRAWKLLVDEFFAGLDRTPACGS
jgi:hypothetical protein